MVAALALVVLAVSADAATAATSVAVVCNAPQVRERIALSGTPQAAISAGGSTWVLTRDGQAGSVIRVDPIGGTAQVVIRVSLPPWSFGYGFGSLWVVGQKEGMRGVTLLRIDPAAGRIVARVQDTHFGLSLAVTSSAVWLSGGETAVHRVYGIDPRLNRVTRIVLLGKATTMSLQARGDQLWSAGWHGLVKIVRGNVVATARIRPDGTKSLSFGVAFAGGTVWSAQAGGESFPGRPRRSRPDLGGNRASERRVVAGPARTNRGHSCGWQPVGGGGLRHRNYRQPHPVRPSRRPGQASRSAGTRARSAARLRCHRRAPVGPDPGTGRTRSRVLTATRESGRLLMSAAVTAVGDAPTCSRCTGRCAR